MDTTPLLDPERVKKLVTDVAEDWGKLVAARRTTLGMEQQTLADAIGTNLVTIKRIELGQQMPRDKHRFAIAYALCTDVDTLFPYPERAKVAEAKSAAA